MIKKESWTTFQESGLLWWTNMLLHTFGWSIVFDYDESGNIIEVYPSRVKFRGFDENTTSNGYEKVSQFMHDNADVLLKESRD